MINQVWDNYLHDVLNKKEVKNLLKTVKDLYLKDIIYPSYDNIFNAFQLVNPEDIKVVIIGQDPYHGPGEAHGLAFSVPEGIATPPSLKNIFKELNRDLNIERNRTNLSDWAEEGVLLLNTVLTVKKDNPNSHNNLGWELFTDQVISRLSRDYSHLVFILWGRYAQNKRSLIMGDHLIITASHPSPLSAYQSFFGSKPFSQTNNYLIENKKLPINW